MAARCGQKQWKKFGTCALSWEVLAATGRHPRGSGDRDRTIVQRADDEVMRLHVIQLVPAIGVYPLCLRVPAVAELADCAGDQSRQVAHDEAGVLAGDFNLT